MAQTFLVAILRSCTGGVLLSLLIIAFRLLREVFFRRDLVAYLVSHGVKFPLAPTPSATSFPQPWSTQPGLVFASASPSPCNAELPRLCLGVVPLGFPSWGFASGRVGCLLPLSPFHLHRLILSFFQSFLHFVWWVFCLAWALKL